MATCGICGAVDERLPESWINWECWQCFLEGCVTCVEPINSKITEEVMADLKPNWNKSNTRHNGRKRRKN